MKFTSKKFLSLKIKQQHKKLSEIVRKIYEDYVKQDIKNDELIQFYNQICEWIGQKPILDFDLEQLSCSFHWHLSLSKQSLKEHRLLPCISSKDRQINSTRDFLPIDIYLDHLRSAHNVGSIIRTVEAMRIGAVHFSSEMMSTKHPQVIKTSMGSHAFVSCLECEDIKKLKKPLLVLETCDQAVSVYDYKFPSTFTLVLGNEEFGVSRSIFEQADVFLNIPMYGVKNSLNVANAFALVCGEIRRQKQF